MLNEFTRTKPILNTIRPGIRNVREAISTPPVNLRPEFEWIDFSYSMNPLGTPPAILAAMRDAIEAGVVSYDPDRSGLALKGVLSKHLGLPADYFLIGTSPTDLIRAIGQTYQRCTVGVTSPCPFQYLLAMTNAGHKVIDLSSPSSFTAPEPNMVRMYGIDFEAALLANPSFPSSRLLQRNTLLKYLETCSWVIVDERSIELTLGGESVVPLVERYHNLIVVRSISTSFGLRGVPISYLVAHEGTVKQIDRFFDNSSITMFGEVISDVLSNEWQYLERTKDLLESEIPWMQFMLNLISGVTIYPSEANFIMCSYTNDGSLRLGAKDVDDLAEQLELNGFRIKRIEGINGLTPNRYFCVCVRTRSENERLVAAMKRIIEG